MQSAKRSARPERTWPGALIGTAAAWKSVLDVVRPAPDRHGGDWALAERVLPQGSAKPGPFDVTLTPYMVPFLKACADPRYKECDLCTGTQMAKCLALDTPIPTPDGWCAMGDLRAGDTVFDDLGRPTEVLAAHEVRHGLPCYRVTFDDGSAITCDSAHLWTVEVRSKHNGVQRIHIETLTTEQMRTEGFRADGGALLSIPLAKPLVLPDADLLIDPYILGVWLGDGHSYSPTVYYGAADDETRINLLAAGAEFTRSGPSYYPAVHRVCIRAMGPKLRALGVFANKHIPTQYLICIQLLCL